MHNNTQISPTLASPQSGAASVQTHTFNLLQPVTIQPNEQYVVDIYADLKYQASPVGLAMKV